MIRASELGGRAVVDMDAAENVGRIEKVIIDPDARRVAGFTVSHGASLISGGTRVTLPASSVHAIGPDLVTVHGSVVANDLEPQMRGIAITLRSCLAPRLKNTAKRPSTRSFHSLRSVCGSLSSA